MAKVQSKIKLSKWSYAALTVLAILIIIFLGRGWIRKTLAPDYAKLFYGRQVQALLDKEYNALNKPFDTLGISPVKKDSGCAMVSAKHFHVTVICGASYTAYSNKVSSLKPDLGTRAMALSTSLKANGWQRGNTTIDALGKNIAKGIDWTPDAAYIKSVGKTFCLTDFNTAFSKPKPPAISGSVSCSRTIELF